MKTYFVSKSIGNNENKTEDVAHGAKESGFYRLYFSLFTEKRFKQDIAGGAATTVHFPDPVNSSSSNSYSKVAIS